MRDRFHRHMNPLSLASEIGIECAYDNPRMVGLQVMQTDKVLAIESQYGPPQTDGIGQYHLVFDRLRCFSGLQDSQYVVSPSSQLFDNRLREVLVGIQFRHESSILVFTNLQFDFHTVSPHVRPRLDDIFRPERRIASQEIGFTGPQPTSLFQHPDRNASSDDTRLTATHPRSALDPGKCISQIIDHRLNQLSLFGSGESRQQCFCLLKRSRHLVPRQPLIKSAPLRMESATSS